MNETAVISCAAVLFLITLFSFAVWAYRRHDDSEKREEWRRVKKELDDEILSGHNLARMSALRKRMRELEADGAGRR